MQYFTRAIFKLDVSFHIISGIVLAFMMLVTAADVIMRNLGYPIVGSVEIISFCGAVVVGFAIPYTSWKKVHVYVDFLVDKLAPRNRKVMECITRCMGIALFAFIGYNFIIFGLDLRHTKEVSPSFKLPYYPISFGLSGSCFLQCLTMIVDLIKTSQRGTGHE
ncbi:MAG: TRAP transporter small permease [Syntrophorhabdaceae bacterium]|nr:TRAP transporter small permease [Syntrophorhabdaceae bacterium]